MATWETAGKVRMTPKGVYSGSVAYEILDIVSNLDKSVSYIAKQNVPAGTALTNTTYWAVIASVEDAISVAEQALSNIAEEYSPGTYAVGDYVTYNGILYKCTTAIISSESWTPAHWTRVVVGDEMKSFLGEIENLMDEIGDLSNLETTAKSDLVSAIN